MKLRLATVIAFVLLLPSAWAGTCGDGYINRRTVIVNHVFVAGSDQTNFPMLVSWTIPYLATIANGGLIQHTATMGNGITGPADLVFCDAYSGGNKLSHEVKSYSATTGTFSARVKVPTLSHTVDTLIYVAYGNPLVSSTQEDVAGTWSNGYQGVWSFPDGVTLNVNGSVQLSSPTNHGATATGSSFLADGAANFVIASSQYIDSGGAYPQSGAYTVEAWINVANCGTSDFQMVVDNFDSAQGYHLYVCDGFGRSLVFLAPDHQIKVQTNIIPEGRWVHIAGTYNGTSSAVYFQGIVQSPTRLGTGYPTVSTAHLNIGNTQGSGGHLFGGMIDELHILNRALSADWIATEYNNDTSPSVFASISAVTGEVGLRQLCLGTSPAGNVSASCQTQVGDVLIAVATDDTSYCSSASTPVTDTCANSFTVLRTQNGGSVAPLGHCMYRAVSTCGGNDTITYVGGLGGTKTLAILDFQGIASNSIDGVGGAGDAETTMPTLTATGADIFICGGLSPDFNYWTAASPATLANTFTYNASNWSRAVILAWGLVDAGTYACTLSASAVPGTGRQPQNEALLNYVAVPVPIDIPYIFVTTQLLRELLALR